VSRAYVQRDILQWRKASFSDSMGECVEVAALNGLVFVRDSKSFDELTLTCEKGQWSGFVRSIVNRSSKSVSLFGKFKVS
jgi:hypothetical protein